MFTFLCYIFKDIFRRIHCVSDVTSLLRTTSSQGDAADGQVCIYTQYNIGRLRTGYKLPYIPSIGGSITFLNIATFQPTMLNHICICSTMNIKTHLFTPKSQSTNIKPYILSHRYENRNVCSHMLMHILKFITCKL